jgi:hypothetical protein
LIIIIKEIYKKFKTKKTIYNNITELYFIIINFRNTR